MQHGGVRSEGKSIVPTVPMDVLIFRMKRQKLFMNMYIPDSLWYVIIKNGMCEELLNDKGQHQNI